MKKLLVLFLLLSGLSLKAKEAPMLFDQSDNLQILVNNRILSIVNGKPITVIDVMKKMDMHFLQQFAQYASVPQARLQYYQVNWKAVLQELIEKELILADAEQSKLEVTGSDVREEMERMFGPNIIENLDKIDISFDEAKQMIQDDIIIRRMTYFRINLKANQLVSPKDVRNAYEEFAKDKIRPDVWRYVMITVRGNESTDNAEIANYLHQLLIEDQVALEDLNDSMENHGYSREGVTYKISEVFEQTDKEIPEANLNILKNLEQGSFSYPIAQRSRADKNMVFRIFRLEEKIEGGVVPYEEASPEIREILINNAMNEEREKYFARLRKHYNIHENQLTEMVPEDFQPFSLQ